jgi:hypothetical protein
MKTLSFLKITPKNKSFLKINRQKFGKLNKILIIKTQDYFKAMLSLFNNTSTPKPKLHQILFCKPDISELEAQTFVRRALNDPLKRLFCVLGFDKLSYSISKMILTMVREHLSQGEDKKEFYLSLLISRGHSGLKDSSKIAKKFEIQKEANDGFLNWCGEYVTSDAPGMGKSFYVKNNLREKQSEKVFTVMLSGKISSYKMKNVGMGLDILRDNPEFDLHLKLNYFTNLNHADYLISVFLFKVSYFRLVE